MKNNKIVAACPAGLGNRIKCMVSTIKECKEVGGIPYVYWPVNDACGCKFEELFKSPQPFKQVWRSELYTIEVDAFHDDAYINKSWKFKFNNIVDMDFKYHKLPKDWIDEFLPYMKYINPKQDIKDTVWAFTQQYKKSFDKGGVIGIHIRKGDFGRLYDGRGEISKEEDFIERMKCLLEVNPDYKFLLCTEDKETEEKFTHIFGNNHIIYFPKRFRGRCTPESIKEAFVDILLLSKCPIIIGTFLSTFTELAWWFGGCKAQVVIPGDCDREAVGKVLAKLPQEGEGIHKKIWRKLMIWKKIII